VLKGHDIIAFVATAQPDRALKFYGEVLGLNLVEDSPFAFVFDVGGRMLRIQKVQTLVPAPHTALGWSVPDIRGAIESLMSRGVTFERYPGMLQDELGVWTSPDGHKVAWFRDADGNNLSLTEFRPR
jgi:catechol 2,3-dioxygenase-like lactoylglutathione lyase family enzyme